MQRRRYRLERSWRGPLIRGRRRNIICNDAESLAGAQDTFERFHSRKVGQGVYPFHRRKQGIFKLPLYVEFPDRLGLVGNAIQTLYESDKWHERGKTVQYYHDHDRGRVKFYEPWDEDEHLKGVQLPYEWPEEVSLIGECIGFIVRLASTGEQFESEMKGKNILVASPDGWVDPQRPNRIFLAIINLDGGGVESIIAGGKLRITSHGIEG